MTDPRTPSQDQLDAMLEDSGAMLKGHFVLSSGKHSGHYLQCARLCAIPRFCEILARELADEVRRGFDDGTPDVVLSPAIGGLVIGYEVARQLDVPALFAERDADSLMTLRRGFEIGPGTRVLIVEDVITTGGSVSEVAKIVHELNARVSGFACLFDRSTGRFRPGPPVFSISKLSFPTYAAESCPLCAEGDGEAVKPGSRR